MAATLEQIEMKIAFLEQANAELSDVVFRQQRDLDGLRLKLTDMSLRFANVPAQATEYTAEEEKPPHY